MRLFVAVDLSEQQRRQVEQLQQHLRRHMSGVKWSAPANLHLTLKFLGEVETTRLAAVLEAAGQAAALMNPFTLSLGGTGVFPDASNPRVLWLGLRDGSSDLQKAAAYLDEKLHQYGFAPDKRPYRPHLTLGRIKISLPASITRRFLDQEKDFYTAAAVVKKLTVYRSTLTKRGPVYSPAGSFIFKF